MTVADRTAWRMEAMCAAVGRPLDCTAAGYPGMAEQCAHCTKGEECLLWRLDGSAGSEAPGYCLNAEEIASLERA